MNYSYFENQRQIKGPIGEYQLGNDLFIVDEITVHEKRTRKYQKQIIQAGLKPIWRNRFFIIIGHIGKFINQLKNAIRQHRPQQHLGLFQYQVVNDIAAANQDRREVSESQQTLRRLPKRNSRFLKFLKSKKNQQLLLKFNRSYSRIVEKFKQPFVSILYKINLSYNFILYWDMFQLFLLIFEVSIIPFSIAFYIPETNIYQKVQLIPIFFFIADIFLNFFKGFYEKGQLINDQIKCINHYFYGSFWIDFPTIITFIIAIFFANFRFLEFVSLLRVLRLGKKYIIAIEENFNLQEKWGSQNLTLVKLSFFIVFSGHIIACIWIYVGKILDNNEKYYESWLGIISSIKYYQIDKVGIRDEQWHQQYITSYYWAVVTMITVGYGDIVPANPTERLFAMLIMVFTCASFAYCLNAISTIFSQMNQNDDEYRKQMSKINVFMSQKQISDDLQRKVRRQLEYIYDEKRKGRLSTQQVLQGISKTLKEEVLVSVNLKMIQQISFFKNNFSNSFLEKMSLKIKDMNVGPEDYVYKVNYDQILIKQENQIDESALFFIEEGQIELFREGKNDSKSHMLTIIKSGSWFGEYSFFTSQARETSARSFGVSYLNYITRSDIMQLFLEFPDEYVLYFQNLFQSKFSYLKESLSIYQDYKILDMKCLSCNSQQHLLFNCPKITYQPNQNRLIRKYLHFKPQGRNKNFSRKHINHYNALIDRLILLEAFQRYYTNNEFLYDQIDFEQLDAELLEMIPQENYQKERKNRSRSINSKNFPQINDERRVMVKSTMLNRMKSLGLEKQKPQQNQNLISFSSNSQPESSSTNKSGFDDEIKSTKTNFNDLLVSKVKDQDIGEEMTCYQVKMSEIHQQNREQYLQEDVNNRNAIDLTCNTKFDYTSLLHSGEKNVKFTITNNEKYKKKESFNPIYVKPSPRRSLVSSKWETIKISNFNRLRTMDTVIQQIPEEMNEEDKLQNETMNVENDFDCYHNFKAYRIEGNIEKILMIINSRYHQLMNEMKSIKLKRLSKFVDQKKNQKRTESLRKSQRQN